MGGVRKPQDCARRRRARGHHARALALATLGLALAPLAHAGVCPGDVELEVAALLNAERSIEGLPPLEVEIRIGEAARDHSADMAENGFFSHTGFDGSSFVDRLERAGYLPLWAGGENIAAGYTTPEAAVVAWMNSPGHRNNILSDRYDHIGVGYVYLPGSHYRHYWTTDFGTTPSEPELADERCGVATACNDGLDNDGDGYTDAGDDPGCEGPTDDSEKSSSLACDDGLDNDGDGRIDHRDRGCGVLLLGSEDPACDDGIDNDGDGFVDFQDPECGPDGPASEKIRACGLGFEASLLACALVAVRRLRRRPSRTQR